GRELAMSESIWKKEITLKRKPKAAPEPKPAKEPVWKKEISLSRKPKSEEPKDSIWKKEISLGRKRNPELETPVLDFDLAPAAEAVWARRPEPPVAEPLVAPEYVGLAPAVEAAWSPPTESAPEPEREPQAEYVAAPSEPEPAVEAL